MLLLIILLCDFQLRTKKFYYHIHIAHFITRHLAHHELTQDKIDCRFIDCIAVNQRLQPCPHLIDSMNITLQNLLLQWLRRVSTLWNNILRIIFSWKKKSLNTVWINNRYLDMIFFSKPCSWV